MTWAFFALLGAFGQALGWALKKKTLENKGINNTLGFVAYSVAGFVFLALWGIFNNFTVPDLTHRFFIAASLVITLNVIAAFTAYKALDQAGLSRLMPFMAFTAIGLVPLEYFVRGIIPSVLQIFGILTVVMGSFILSFRETLDKGTMRTAGLFGITLVCYTLASLGMAIMLDETASPFFSATLMHLGIAIGFILLIFYSKEYRQFITPNKSIGLSVVGLMILSGLIIALLENGPIFVALQEGTASEVFAIKRVMPFFALLFGATMFGEQITWKHIVGTSFLVLGSVSIVLL